MEYKLIEPILPIYDYYTTLEKIFAARGIAPEDIHHYLNTTLDDILPPESIKNIKEGATMLIKHIAAQDKIMVQADADCDGFTSASLLINYINALFPWFAQNCIYYRVHNNKHHGIILNTVPEDVKLVIAPDASSNEISIHEALYNRGIDVLVIDHHESNKVSPHACIINNQLCDYPTKSLSGAGMVWKFCCYIDKLLDKNVAYDFIDLAALGILGDMMSLRDYETVEIVRQGFAQVRNPFFSEMAKVQSYSINKNGGLNPYTVAFYIVPQINGAIRVGTPEEKLLLFESMLDFKAYELIPSTKRGYKGQFETRVEQACRTCTNTKRHQTSFVDENQAMIEKIIQEKHLTDNKIIAVKLDENHQINRNLTGLMANRLMGKYQHPILLLTKVTHEDGSITWEGSGRGYTTADFSDLKAFLNDSGLVEYAQGHAQAFGVSIKDENFDKLIAYSNEVLKDYNFKPAYIVDFIWHNGEMSATDVLNIGALSNVWGQDMPQPKVALKLIIPARDIELMSRDKNPTLKFKLSNGTSMIKFKSSEEEYENLTSSESVIIEAVGTCAVNEFGGNISPQILIEEYEIVGKLESYF